MKWLAWRDKEMIALMLDAARGMATELGQRVVRDAKRQLTKDPPHGVRTGTMRRDIHAEKPKVDLGRLQVSVKAGTGVRYAPFVEFGHQSFPGYAFMRLALAKVMKDDAPYVAGEYGLKWRS